MSFEGHLNQSGEVTSVGTRLEKRSCGVTSVVRKDSRSFMITAPLSKTSQGEREEKKNLTQNGG